MRDEMYIARAARLAAPIFQEMEWKYGGGKDCQSHIPTSEELALTIARLVALVRSQPPEGSCSSGRMHVSSDEGGNVTVEVMICEIPSSSSPST